MKNKFPRFYALAPILLFILMLFVVVGVSMMSARAQESTPDNNQNAVESSKNADSADENTNIQNVTDQNTTEVTTQKVGSDQEYYLDLLGTITAESQVTVYPSTSGQITGVNVKEGEHVEKGEVMFVIGGPNGTEHPTLKQYEIAKTNYETAVKSYNNTANSMDIAVQSAELQLESAKHQARGSYLDYQAMAANIESSKDGIGLIRSTLTETQMKNQRDLNNMEEKIEDMKDTIDDFEDTRSETLLDLMEKIDTAPDQETKAALEQQFEEVKAQFKSQEKELDNGLEELENGYDSLKSGAVLSENQILGQLQQAQSQNHQLHISSDSMQWKLGLFDGTSDPVKLAEQGVNNAKAQASSALTQAKSGLELAKLNLSLVEDQKKYLLVKAPVSGTVSSVTVKEGASASPQAPAAQIVNTNDYTLTVGVDSENAQYITLNSKAEVMIGGQYIKVPIVSISPVADPASKLVNVKLQMPKISLRPNQTLQARISLNPAEGSNKSIYIPLDAVTIGTERQFVFILDGNKAKEVTVELGKINGDLVEIKSGLKGDEEIIVEGARDVLDGDTVTIKQ